jgi:hypothetical protein
LRFTDREGNQEKGEKALKNLGQIYRTSTIQSAEYGIWTEIYEDNN